MFISLAHFEVSIFASFSRCYHTFQCLWLELCWATLALTGFLLVHSKIEEDSEEAPARKLFKRRSSVPEGAYGTCVC